ncbi:GH20174 [Drosophila grimshawi]|uniref:GH20174 n=1 Tax=Drosophila grimshawi TaxID=7222 RepID=B4J677_DROGR|nr:GH20174 [Drosophila grimshawi]
MDRNKSSAVNRGQKKALLGAELFALGTKTGRDDPKKILPIKGIASTSSSSVDRKRDASSSLANHPSKRFRAGLKDGATEMPSTSGTVQHEIWEQLAEECDLSNVIECIYSAIEQSDNEAVMRIICGVIRHATSTSVASRAKVDSVAYLTLLFVAKVQPNFFNNDVVAYALLSFLRRETNMKMRYNINLHILFTNLLARGFADIAQWPEVLLRTYIEDAVNERFWADNDYCAPFVKNICAAFKTRTPHLSLLRWDVNTAVTPGQTHRENFTVDDDSGDNSTQSLDASPFLNWELDQATDAICAVKRRFPDNMVHKLVSEAIRDQLNKRQQQDNYTRNFLKFLCSSAGIGEVRCLSISRLELWIHNGKLVKFAQQLLSYICFNIKGKNTQDNEVLQVLVKMRLKTKPLINHYMSCLKEMIHLQPDILGTIMKLVVQNELSNTRNPNNMGMLATMFQTSPDQSAVNLAEIYQEFLLQRDDCLRTLRVFLRELVRMLRFDVNLLKFCKTFLSEREELNPQIEQFDFKERIFHSMVDIVCLCMFLSATPQAREGSLSLKTNRDVKNNQALIRLYNQMSQIQLDSVSWMYETVPNLFKIQGIEYHQALHKLLLLDNPEQYSRCDQWPSEPERGAILRIISETPIHEETLLRIILIGITKDIPFSIANTFDILLLVIKRVSGMKATDYPAVQANKFDIIDFLFSMSEYHHPENIRLPADYEPPKLAIIAFYWKAWLILLMISAHNPSTFGAFCWDHYPTMKMLMEICITSQFNNCISLKDELQIITVERDHILQFETYLAAQTSPHAVITEENAILITQLMLMDPMGNPRKVPNLVLEQLKFLNQTYKLGHLFCRCRKPDLLLDIIQRQGTTQSMPWLSDLVQNSEGDFSHLPVQCLCEFLLFNANSINEENSRDAELVNFIRNLITDASYNYNVVCEVLDYIFRRLSSTVSQSRVAALSGLKIIFKNVGKYEHEWLLKSIQQIPHFMEAKMYIIPQLRAACQVENCPQLIMAYIQFITAHTLNDPVNEMLDHVIDMAQLIVERSTMFQHIIISQEDYDLNPDENRIQTLKCLFVMFNNYIIKLREFHEPYEWTEYPDLLMVQFDDGVQLPLHINIIHAFIILLTYSNAKMSESIPILDYWFPPGRPAPVAFLPTMPQEQIQLLPDWLKLKMIRSSVDRLIEAALNDLTPDQIVLFVQNFGTPVNSMSKLLAMLDTAVLEQFDLVKNAILNKAYLAQLIEIQQARGAKNGHYTVQALDLHSHSQTVPDLPKINTQIQENLHIVLYDPESVPNATNKSPSKETISMLLKTPNPDLCFRMNLLFKLTEKRKGLMVKVVEYVEKSTIADSLKDQVLQQLYIMYPRIKFLKYCKLNGQTCKLQSLKGCQADKISNNLITCLGSLVAKKDFETLSADTELLLRKLAASHPLLFLRHLGVLSSAMQGRAQNSMKALREDHHFHRFVQILRTLELLQPTIFDDAYKNEIQSTLSCYFTFFKHHSSVKEACQMLVKFVQVLQSYINCNPSSALLFIEQYVGILTELAVKYTSIGKLQALVQAVALLQHKSNTLSELDDEEVKLEYELDGHSSDTKPATNKAVVSDIEPLDGNLNVQDVVGRGSFSVLNLGTAGKANLTDVSPHFLDLIKIIKQSNIEDVILGPLQEMECLTSKRFVFINELFERLLDLIFSPSAQIRSIAFIILIRHLKHNPGNSDINQCTLNAYIQCLRDENSSVAATAIDNLLEMCILLQEHAVEILCVAFSLGIRSCLNTNNQIRKVMQTLVVQHGY